MELVQRKAVNDNGEDNQPAEASILTGMILDTSFLSKVATVDLNRLLSSKYSKIMAGWCLEYFAKYGKAPGSSITEITGNKISRLSKNDPALAGLMLRLIENIAERYGDNEEVFDTPFHLELAETYLQSRALVLRREEEERLLEAGDVGGALKLQSEFKPLRLNINQAPPLFTSDLPKIEIPERKMIIFPFQKEGSIGNLYADRGTGKSVFALEWLISATSKCEFGPWPIEQNINCALVDGELEIDDIRERLEQATGDFKTKRPLMLISSSYRVMQGLPPINLLDPNTQNWLLQTFIDNDIRFVVFDNLGALAPGIDENVKKDYDPINQFWLKLRFHRIAALMIHHTGKNGEQRGTSAREDNVDFCITLKKPAGYDPTMGARFTVNFTKGRVRNQHLSYLRKVEAHYTLDPVGEYIWDWDTPSSVNDKEYRKNKILAQVAMCIVSGMSQAKIAERFGKGQPWVSKNQAKLIKDGIVEEQDDGIVLTGKGNDFLDEYSN